MFCDKVLIMKQITTEQVIKKLKSNCKFIRNFSIHIENLSIIYNKETKYYLISGTYSYFYRDLSNKFHKSYSNFNFPMDEKEL